MLTILWDKQLPPQGVQLCLLAKDHPSWACQPTFPHKGERIVNEPSPEDTAAMHPCVICKVPSAHDLGEGLEYRGWGKLGGDTFRKVVENHQSCWVKTFLCSPLRRSTYTLVNNTLPMLCQSPTNWIWFTHVNFCGIVPQFFSGNLGGIVEVTHVSP